MVSGAVCELCSKTTIAKVDGEFSLLMIYNNIAWIIIIYMCKQIIMLVRYVAIM